MADSAIVEQNVEASMSRWLGAEVERNWGLVPWISSSRTLPLSALLLTSRWTGIRDCRVSPWQRLMFVAQFRYMRSRFCLVCGERPDWGAKHRAWFVRNSVVSWERRQGPRCEVCLSLCAPQREWKGYACDKLCPNQIPRLKAHLLVPQNVPWFGNEVHTSCS